MHGVCGGPSRKERCAMPSYPPPPPPCRACACVHAIVKQQRSRVRAVVQARKGSNSALEGSSTREGGQQRAHACARVCACVACRRACSSSSARDAATLVSEGGQQRAARASNISARDAATLARAATRVRAAAQATQQPSSPTHSPQPQPRPQPQPLPQPYYV